MGISPEPFVNKQNIFQSVFFYPEFVRSGYTLYLSPYPCGKPLKKFMVYHLSTEKPAFTTITIYIYK